MRDGNTVLRALEAHDLEHTRSWHNDSYLWARTMGFRLPVTEHMEEQWFQSIVADNNLTRCVWAIEQADSGGIVGVTMLAEIDWFSRTAAFGVLIGDPAARGLGHGRRALHLVTEFGRANLGLHKLTLRVVDFNEQAVALYETAGWEHEGRQRRQFFTDGRHHDVIWMARFLQSPAAADDA